jgi:hypothetical protein
MVHPVFIQTFYYGVVMILTIFFLGFLQKGFLFKFIKVKLSFGKYVLVKVRSVIRDYYAVGEIMEGNLIYKVRKNEKRLSIPDNKPFYRSIGVMWVDVDEEKNAICKADYSTTDGYDAIKINNLLKRALTSPVISSNKDKIMFAMLIGLCIVVGIVAFIVFQQDQKIMIIQRGVEGIAKKMGASIERAVI